MASAFILYLENEVTFRSNSPTAGQIEAALQSIPVVAARMTRQASGLADNGGFVGSARITRRTNLLPPGGRITNVAWLYSWTTRPTPEAEVDAARDIAEYIQAQANQLFTSDAGWKPAQILPYDPATNGSLAWWTDGTASQTATRDSFDLNEQAGSNQSVDNATGPTTNHAPDADPFHSGDPNSAFNKILGLATTALWVAGGIATLFYVVGPALSAVLPKARTNPGPSIPPATVRRVWKAVEEAPARDRLKVASAFSRDRLLAALSWNDRNGDYDQLDQDTLARYMAEAVDVGDGHVSDIGSRRR